MGSPGPRTLLAAGALLVLGAIAVLWRSGSERPDAEALARQSPSSSAAGEGRADPALPARPDSAPSLIETSPVAAGRSCAVHGRVLEHTGAGLPSLTVELHLGRDRQLAQTDAEGRFAFRELQRGLYRLYLDAESLPAGMRVLPPWRQQPERRDDGQSAGLAGTVFRLTDDSDPEVDLHVFLAGTVRGRVIEASGKPIVNAIVGIQTAGGIQDSTRTDVGGRFVFEEAYPGASVTSVDLSRVLAIEASAPLPQHFELAPGGTVVLDDLVAGVGGHVLRGSVADLAGQPIVGLGVLCQEESEALYRLRWTTVTDAEGHYELGRLPATQLVLSLGAEDRDRPPDSRLLAENVAPLRVDTREAPETVELGVVTVAGRHPFHVRGIVRIDDAWAESHGIGWTARAEVRAAGQAVAQPLVMPALSWEPGSTVRTSRFSWACATPHQEVNFRAVLTGLDGQEHERLATVTPSADGTQEVELSFP